MIMRTRLNEVELVGRWLVRDGRVERDDAYERIEMLTEEYLEKAAVSEKMVS